MSDGSSASDVKRLLDHALDDFFPCPRRGIQQLAGGAIAIDEGIETTTPNNYGTVRDIRSAKRLGLIWDMQVNQATEYARYKMDHDPDVLDAYPAQRLMRIEDREHPRPSWFWPDRWALAFAKVGGAGAIARSQASSDAEAAERMVNMNKLVHQFTFD
jgi:hypothetical protein